MRYSGSRLANQGLALPKSEFRVAVGGLGLPFVHPVGHLRSEISDNFAWLTFSRGSPFHASHLFGDSARLKLMPRCNGFRGFCGLPRLPFTLGPNFKLSNHELWIAPLALPTLGLDALLGVSPR